MENSGYYRYPTLYNDTVIFVSEGDLWSLNIDNPIARRLSFNKGTIKTPVMSPDGHYIAFSCSTEGHSEVYIIPSTSGEMKRLTYLGDDVSVVAWTQEEGIIFASAYGQPFQKWNVLWRIAPEGGMPEKLNVGPANFISFANGSLGSGSVIQRHGYREYGYWKRYRGGTAGDVWIDAQGKGDFKKLFDLKADLSRPLWVKDKIIFAADHEGVGNLYHCNLDGTDIKRLTHHGDYYVRGQAVHGNRVVYHAGADLWLLDLETRKSEKINVTYHSDRSQRARKFFFAPRYLQHYDVHPKGHHISLVTRGKLCVMGNWDGPVTQLGERDGIRYRLPTWLGDGKHMVAVCDDAIEEKLVVFDAETTQLTSRPTPVQEKKMNLGRVIHLWTNPVNDSAILFNHRSEVIFVDLKKWTTKVIDRSEQRAPTSGGWSPDGRWFTYGASLTRHKMAIKVFDQNSGDIHQVTNPIQSDTGPVFDPEGKYIYFISERHFDPVYDALQFELGFPYAAKIYAIPLRKDIVSPFLKLPEKLVQAEDEADQDESTEKKEDKKAASKVPEVQIDFDDITKRLFEFPIEAGNYSHLCAVKGKIYFISHAIEGALEAQEHSDSSISTLESFDIETLKGEQISSGVSAVTASLDQEFLIVRYGRKLRVLKAGEKPEEDSGFTKKSGWIDLARIKLMVTPALEWQHMYKEAWRLQRDHYWVEDMSSINWRAVYERYEPLLSRISTREEFSDLVWEMQGELGTSHAYVMGGDLKQPPHWNVGSLAADFTWDKTRNAYKISNISQGDPWNDEGSSPFAQAGIAVGEGDYLISINRQALNERLTPQELLFHKAGDIVELEVANNAFKDQRFVHVRTLENQYKTRYRDWVEANRRYVHEQTQGKVGYIHIPDMGPNGYAEFHRNFLQEIDREGLIIDVRFNGGGHVSQLLIEKLARKRLGYDVTRWHGYMPYPEDAPMGPMVAITNEYAGSDGDLFSHVFKAAKLGPLIGKRTWGGVIGIWPRYGLVDGGMTTQPEFSFWFEDIGWAVENYGVEPDQVVEMLPQDYANNRDPQLDCGLKAVMEIVKVHPKNLPDLTNRPSLAIPLKLPEMPS
jgi:tricorn protease